VTFYEFDNWHHPVRHEHSWHVNTGLQQDRFKNDRTKSHHG
jgi:hypothetical protein